MAASAVLVECIENCINAACHEVPQWQKYVLKETEKVRIIHSYSWNSMKYHRHADGDKTQNRETKIDNERLSSLSIHDSSKWLS
jgi:hypothetical protein